MVYVLENHRVCAFTGLAQDLTVLLPYKSEINYSLGEKKKCLKLFTATF